MEYNKQQRLVLVWINNTLQDNPVVTTADKFIKDIISPAVINLVNDCNELELELEKERALSASLLTLMLELYSPQPL